MLKIRKLNILGLLGLELWLLLPLLGIGFWVGGGFVTERILNRDRNIDNKYLKHDAKSLMETVAKVISVKAQINRSQNSSVVTVKTINSPLKVLLFEFPTTEKSEIERAISKELDLPLEGVKRAIRYLDN
ncbi:MAG: hypothetical protein HC908_14355 [Calothrix sp. SM1_7_51]|nr:hypothetical protein [Calothrix sp. SM1_7_51]